MPKNIHYFRTLRKLAQFHILPGGIEIGEKNPIITAVPALRVVDRQAGSSRLENDGIKMGIKVILCWFFLRDKITV